MSRCKGRLLTSTSVFYKTSATRQSISIDHSPSHWREQPLISENLLHRKEHQKWASLLRGIRFATHACSGVFSDCHKYRGYERDASCRTLALLKDKKCLSATTSKYVSHSRCAQNYRILVCDRLLTTTSFNVTTSIVCDDTKPTATFKLHARRAGVASHNVSYLSHLTWLVIVRDWSHYTVALLTLWRGNGIRTRATGSYTKLKTNWNGASTVAAWQSTWFQVRGYKRTV